MTKDHSRQFVLIVKMVEKYRKNPVAVRKVKMLISSNGGASHLAAAKALRAAQQVSLSPFVEEVSVREVRVWLIGTWREGRC